MDSQAISEQVQRQYDLMLDISTGEVRAALLGCTVPLPIGQIVELTRSRGMTPARLVEVILDYEMRILLHMAQKSGKTPDFALAEVQAIMLRRRTGRPV